METIIGLLIWLLIAAGGRRASASSPSSGPYRGRTPRVRGPVRPDENYPDRSSSQEAQQQAAAAADRARSARARAEAAAAAAAAAARAQQSPRPWPQAMPANLPAWPGGWEHDQPPPSAVVTRAWQLLDQLWAHGAGTRQTEQTAGRWITYVAEITASKKQGVVAYRPRSTTATRAVPGGRTVTTPAVDARPLLLQGAGMGALAGLAPHVAEVQRKLHVVPVDGKFGSDTREAVKTFQRSRHLNDDGKVGPNTWGALDLVSDPARSTNAA